ncbi:hypothetical protein [Cypionkella sp.]|jgi:hypothetical protein|uniref:hypothetical protein n=1 Tax=Cypionkella sp. TaxID=2811411 RepID=UPI002719DC9C|nr:hypothetical protein [Cypionkella sp.]MDO8983725.1 hypothetical protein [Cypionkella sp.]MDP2051829.1 hypothetical protein [Cypionkella sp.]
MSNRSYASETLAETIHARRDTRQTPMFTLKRQANILIVLLIAISLLAATAMPSHADKRGDNFAKIIAGALVIGLIAKTIDDNKDRNKPKPHHPQPQPYPEPSYLPRVPSVCAISIDSNSGDAVTMYSQKCLRREGFDYRLPNCARDVRIYGEADRVYSAQCLRDAGFRLGR